MQSTKLFFVSVPIFAAVSAHGQIAYNNLAGSVTGAAAVAGDPLADSFSVGPNAAILSNVVLSLQNPTGGNWQFSVSLETDNNTSPGNLIVSSTVPDSVVGAGVTNLYVPIQPTLLSANTRYWIQLFSIGGGSTAVAWDWTTTPGVGTTGEYWADIAGVFPNVDGPFRMELNAVPEPPSIAFLGLGVLPLLLRRRKSD